MEYTEEWIRVKQIDERCTNYENYESMIQMLDQLVSTSDTKVFQVGETGESKVSYRYKRENDVHNFFLALHKFLNLNTYRYKRTFSDPLEADVWLLQNIRIHNAIVPNRSSFEQKASLHFDLQTQLSKNYNAGRVYIVVFENFNDHFEKI